jgi:hypothetical protein
MNDLVILECHHISLSHWKEAFKDEFDLVILRAKPSSSGSFEKLVSSSLFSDVWPRYIHIF